MTTAGNSADLVANSSDLCFAENRVAEFSSGVGAINCAMALKDAIQEKISELPEIAIK